MQLVIFLLALFIFTVGPGIAITGRLTRDLDPLRRWVVAFGVGTAAAPVLINVLGRLHLVPAFPYLAVKKSCAKRPRAASPRRGVISSRARRLWRSRWD